MEKKKVIVSYKNLPENVLKAVHEKYPDGFTNHVIKVPKGADDYFYAITVETKDTKYLVKVDVVVDTGIDLDNYIASTIILEEPEVEEIEDPDEFSDEDMD